VFVLDPETEKKDRLGKEGAAKQEKERQAETQARQRRADADARLAKRERLQAERKKQGVIARQKRADAKLHMAKELISEGKPSGKMSLHPTRYQTKITNGSRAAPSNILNLPGQPSRLGRDPLEITPDDRRQPRRLPVATPHAHRHR
jgi:hypothetical protein